ncbi:polymorphic toxin-type HINT domain-containing protein [Streptomyces sp. NPDC057137]|uniref:polymorphic toxin-type HINT domain-containing protein n=1 Tax=Streptomyces sp. NPDC057137 TaxID=3346030 RepID=UPI00362928B4
MQIGDQVLATDPETGESGPRPVTALIKGTGDKQLVDITLDTDKTSTLTATDGHPFWVPALGRWIEAHELTTGQWLQTSTGTWTQITGVTHRVKQTTVYNLTVDDIHTYYVLAGATPVLVHNICPKPGRAPEGSTLEEYAGANRGVNQDATPDFVTEYTSPSGVRYYGRTTPGGVDIEPGSNLADALRGHHGGCAEVCALNEAQKAEGGLAIYGGTFRTLRVRPQGSPLPHGASADPCKDFCQPLIGRVYGTW